MINILIATGFYFLGVITTYIFDRRNDKKARRRHREDMFNPHSHENFQMRDEDGLWTTKTLSGCAYIAPQKNDTHASKTTTG